MRALFCVGGAILVMGMMRVGAADESVKPEDVDPRAKTAPHVEVKEPFFDWIGTVRKFSLYRTWRGQWSKEFTLELERENEEVPWLVVSRMPTPYYEYQCGTSFTDLKVDWTKGPLVRVIGVKKPDLDRANLGFHDLKLDLNRTVTALLVYVWQDNQWKPYHVNNWFHAWKNDVPGLLSMDIAQFYVDQPAPFDVWQFLWHAAPDDATSPVYSEEVLESIKGLTDRSLCHGWLVSDPKAQLGYRLKLIHFINDAKGFNLIFGREETLVRLDKAPPPEGSANQIIEVWEGIPH